MLRFNYGTSNLKFKTPNLKQTKMKPKNHSPLSTLHFQLKEFACKDGTPVPEKYYDNVKELMQNLQVLRNYLSKPITINSGYRTEKHNTEEGGKKNSQHLLAKASDIVVKGISPKIVYQTIEQLIEQNKMKQGGLGLYNTFVHYDIRGVKARWDFRKIK